MMITQKTTPEEKVIALHTRETQSGSTLESLEMVIAEWLILPLGT